MLGTFIGKPWNPPCMRPWNSGGANQSLCIAGETPEEALLDFWKRLVTARSMRRCSGALASRREAHMLKPFPVRVQATKAFIESTVQFMAERRRTQGHPVGRGSPLGEHGNGSRSVEAH